MSDPCVQNVCNDIIKSGGDKREYRALTLDNDMLVLLISDPTTDKSSAAMDVHIGHLSDPTELPGLAHFCEHMLFLGTEKYPEENAYSKFLSSNGGSSNAFTTPEHTNFYFDVAPDQLPGALDRFSQFFLAPLFTESATGREVNAVNSENDKNIQNDAWRIHQLEKSTANPSHPYSKFGTGNKTTLETHPKELGLDVRDELLKFHSNFYSSNIMSLAILGKESLDELQSMVVPLVRDVKNKNVAMPEWLEHPYGPDQLKLQAHIVPIKDVRSLHVIWPMPDLHKYYKSNPGHYLGHLIGHEGPGSLLSELRNRGWVTQLVGGEKTGAKGFQFFNINVDLSEEGIDHVDDIITLMFQYIHMLRDEGPQQWVFKECQDLYNMQFLFKDKEKPSGYTSHCAAMLRDYPLKEILSGPYLLEDYDPSKIDMVLEKLVPETIRIAVIGQKFKGQTDLTEKWYGTEYSITNITEEKLQHWRSCGTHPNLKLPLPNDFIPTNFDLLQRDDDPAPLPQVIKDNELTRLWYCQDNVFLMPKACINVEMLSPYAYMDPLCTNMTHMFVALLQDTLNEYAYAAELAGISYNFHGTIYGLTLTVSGYHDKQHILLQKVLDKIVSFQIDPQRYAILLESYIRQLKNFKAEQPHRHAMYYTSMLTSEQMWTKDELLEATQELSIEKIHAFIPQLLSKLYLELLVYGNVTKERAHQITDILEATLKTEAHTKPLPASQRRRFREIQLPDNSSYVHHSHNDVHPSGSVEVYYQCTQQNTHNNMILELFCQLINESAFNELRTKQQLGYIVFSGARRSSGVQGLRFIVQSDREPAYVDSRIEAFLVSFYKELQDMDDEAFKKHLEALATKRLEKAKKLSSQNSRYWSEIITHLYNFDRANIEVDHLKTLSKKDILEFYEELLSHDSVKRRKMASYVTGTGTTSDKTEGKTEGAGQDNGKDEPLTEPPAVKQAEEIVDMNAFKEGMALYPLAKPFITITPTISKL